MKIGVWLIISTLWLLLHYASSQFAIKFPIFFLERDIMMISKRYAVYEFCIIDFLFPFSFFFNSLTKKIWNCRHGLSKRLSHHIPGTRGWQAGKKGFVNIWKGFSWDKRFYGSWNVFSERKLLNSLLGGWIKTIGVMQTCLKNGRGKRMDNLAFNWLL